MDLGGFVRIATRIPAAIRRFESRPAVRVVRRRAESYVASDADRGVPA